MEFQKFAVQNIKSISLLIYVILFTLLIINKPIFLFNQDGSVKEFGLSNMNKTVLPLWLIIIGVAILSYMGVLYYLAYGFHRY